MTLAVRFHVMEHFKSTIVTTAVLITGLVTAAHVLHPWDPASESAVGRPVAAAIDTATAWSDPPARGPQRVAGTEVLLRRPPTFTLLPVAMTESLSAAEAQGPVRHTRKVEVSRDRRPSRFSPHTRVASVGPRSEGPASDAVQASATSGDAAKGDPIGNLLKALGLGRDGEG